jgi:hypothetical protein
METPDHKELEDFIHSRLQQLPEREAPEDLLANVMAAVNARQNRPWWKEPFTSWPRGVQSILFILLGSLFSALAYFAAKPSQALSMDALTARASSVSWVPRLVFEWLDAAVKTVSSLPWPWLAGIGVAVCAMYLGCVAGGIALFRITSSSRAA